MVKDANPDNLRNGKQFFRKSHVPFARRRISRRMIVRDNDSMRPPSDCFTKDFPRMHGHGRNPSLGYRYRLADRVEVRIDRQNKENLATAVYVLLLKIDIASLCFKQLSYPK